MMRKISLIIGLVSLFSVACKAQESYQISGKVNGMADGPFLLIANEGEKPTR